MLLFIYDSVSTFATTTNQRCDHISINIHLKEPFLAHNKPPFGAHQRGKLGILALERLALHLFKWRTTIANYTACPFAHFIVTTKVLG